MGFQEIKQQPFPMIQPSVKMVVKKAYLLGELWRLFLGSTKKKRLTFIPRFAKDFLTHGVVAQLGERLNGIQEVVSSILSSSTRFLKLIQVLNQLFCMEKTPRYAGGSKKLTALPMSVKLLLIC